MRATSASRQRAEEASSRRKDRPTAVRAVERGRGEGEGEAGIGVR
jgi:hypothetical protein